MFEEKIVCYQGILLSRDTKIVGVIRVAGLKWLILCIYIYIYIFFFFNLYIKRVLQINITISYFLQCISLSLSLFLSISLNTTYCNIVKFLIYFVSVCLQYW